jgi:hypothetical protein
VFNAYSKLKILTIAISIIAEAVVPSILSNKSSAQTKCSGATANTITISSSGKNYKCTATPQTLLTLSIYVSAYKEDGALKGQWHIIGTEFGGKKVLLQMEFYINKKDR